MVDVKNLIEKLNEEQIKPVLDTEGAVLVIAGAGSGKTRVLTTRIAYLVQEKKTDPANILAITFTNKAAKEMKERLTKILDGVNEMWVCTIHSMCVRILRSHIDRIGYDRNFTIYDDTDRERTIKRVIEELSLNPDKLLKPAKSYISIAKNGCLTPDMFEKEFSSLNNVQEITNIYRLYEIYLHRSNSLDFDDLLLKTYELFDECPEIADQYSNKFKYIHIDEFQDTNRVQFYIADRLSRVHGNLFVVGDDDQSIYSWRGADVDNILSFDKTHGNATVYKLERNYRSTKKILELANSIISHNESRRKKELWTDNEEGSKIEIYVGDNENDEATYAVMQIKNLMARDSRLTYKDFAVFMRVNALSRAYEQEFLKYNIPFKIYGGFKFFERKEIKDVLSYLKIINNPKDDESFLRSIQNPKRGIGEKSLQDLIEYCASKQLSLFDGISDLDDSTLSQSTKNKLNNYRNLLLGFIEYYNSHNVTEVLDYVIKTTSFLDQYKEKNEENTSKLLNISELMNSAEQFLKDNPNATLRDYLESITLSSDMDDIKSDNVVSIATIHASKGLEFTVVFVSGLDEGIIPTPRSVGNTDELEEERRLMYVAITRAKQRLYLTRASSRYLYGRREFMTQSRFLKEAQAVVNPNFGVKKQDSEYGNGYGSYGKSYIRQTDSDGYVNDFYEQREVAPSGGYSSAYAKTMLSSNKPKLQRTADKSRIKSGATVKHPKFGTGTVILIKGEGDNTIIDVAFKGVGVKALSLKYAPIEIL